MKPQALTFIDVETTGTSARFGNIIEIGVLRVENGEVVEQFNSLVDPQVRLDPFITRLTGITQFDLQHAPTFRDISDTVYELFNNAIFVAHNAQFDYAFLRQEFARLGREFTMQTLCTVKFARALFPGYKSYSLEHVIHNLHIPVEVRHRAFEDARVLVRLYEMAKETHGIEKVEEVVNTLLKRTSWPAYLDKNIANTLPRAPGIYTFFGEDGMPLYVGKSIHIKDRVLSHFTVNSSQAADVKILKEVRHIEVQETAGELGALLLESQTIKRVLPILNQRLRKTQLLTLVCLGTETNGYKTAKITTLANSIAVDAVPLSSVLVVSRSKRQANELLRSLAEKYRLCPVLLGIEKSQGACFSAQLGTCLGACTGKELYLKYNMRFDEAFANLKIKQWPFAGPILLKETRGDMSQSFLMQNWCYLGEVHENEDIPSLLQKTTVFDYDTYKILVSYIYGKRRGVEIVEVSQVIQ